MILELADPKLRITITESSRDSRKNLICVELALIDQKRDESKFLRSFGLSSPGGIIWEVNNLSMCAHIPIDYCERIIDVIAQYRFEFKDIEKNKELLNLNIINLCNKIKEAFNVTRESE